MIGKLVIICGLFALGILNSGAAEKPTAVAKTEAPPVIVEIPKSVFEIPASPREGRNPFFPEPIAPVPTIVNNQPKGPDDSAIVLNGISSPPKRMAMLNGKTFEPGETGEVKLPNGGKIFLQCLEIGKESVTILVGEQRRELRLRNGI